MSEFFPALQYTLNFEDPNREYHAVPDVGNSHSIAGINSAVFPVAFLGLNSLPPAQRPSPVAQFYFTDFWVPMGVGMIKNQDLANRVFDEGVNVGSETSIKLLQQATNALGGELDVDGQNGPRTITAVNRCVPVDLLNAFRDQRVLRYREIVASKPDDARYLAGWEARARA